MIKDLVRWPTFGHQFTDGEEDWGDVSISGDNVEPQYVGTFYIKTSQNSFRRQFSAGRAVGSGIADFVRTRRAGMFLGGQNFGADFRNSGNFCCSENPQSVDTVILSPSPRMSGPTPDYVGRALAAPLSGNDRKAIARVERSMKEVDHPPYFTHPSDSTDTTFHHMQRPFVQ